MPFSDIAIPCPACGQPMARAEVVTQENGPRIELYKCPDQDCGRRAALMYEPGGGLTESGRTFVEQEVARLGAFFPQDYTRTPGLRRG